MTDDLLERQLSVAMTQRAAVATPRPPRFDDVESRANRHRRRRTNAARVIGVASVALLVLGVLTAVGLRDRSTDVIVGPADDPVESTEVPAVDRWGVFPDMEPLTADLPAHPSVGVGPDAPTFELMPYLVLLPSDDDHDIIYGLDGDRWSSTRADFQPTGPSSVATTFVVTGTPFDPGSFAVVPNTRNSFRPRASGEVDPDAGVPNPFENARPEQLLAAPESWRPDVSVEQLGGYEWVVLPPVCSPQFDQCRTVALGGDDETLVLVDTTAPAGFDVRTHLAELELRPGDALERPPGESDATIRPGFVGVQPTESFGTLPWLFVYLPLSPDDAAWPADVPSEYCAAYLQWKQIQVENLGAFGTPGWIRWVEALGAIAPPDVGDDYAVLAAERSAGHDVSATSPGRDALVVVVSDGDARCPG